MIFVTILRLIVYMEVNNRRVHSTCKLDKPVLYEPAILPPVEVMLLSSSLPGTKTPHILSLLETATRWLILTACYYRPRFAQAAN